jgi:hypothetical protein
MIVDTQPVAYPPDYLHERERAWERVKAIHGAHLWNGRIWTVRGAQARDGKLVLSTSACEYKDIVFKQEAGAGGVARRFGPDCLHVHGFTAAVPVTRDGYGYFGVVGRGTLQQEGLLDLIGGSLNLDERSLDTIGDVMMMTIEELEEEADIAVAPSACELLSLNFHSGSCFFLFRVRLDAEPTAARLPNEELAGLERCRCEDVGGIRRPVTPDLALFSTYAGRLSRRANADHPAACAGAGVKS